MSTIKNDDMPTVSMPTQSSSLESLIFTQESFHSVTSLDTLDIPSLADLQECRLQRGNKQKMFCKQCIIAKGNKDINDLERMQLTDLEFSYEAVLEILLKGRAYWEMKVSNKTAVTSPELQGKRHEAIYDRVTTLLETILPMERITLVSDYNEEKLFINEYYAQVRNLRTHMQQDDEDEVKMVIIYYILSYNNIIIYILLICNRMNLLPKNRCIKELI